MAGAREAGFVRRRSAAPWHPGLSDASGWISALQPCSRVDHRSISSARQGGLLERPGAGGEDSALNRAGGVSGQRVASDAAQDEFPRFPESALAIKPVHGRVLSRRGRNDAVTSDRAGQRTIRHGRRGGDLSIRERREAAYPQPESRGRLCGAGESGRERRAPLPSGCARPAAHRHRPRRDRGPTTPEGTRLPGPGPGRLVEPQAGGASRSLL